MCAADVARFNDMFLEREEDAVIRLRSLEDEGSAAHTAAVLKDVYRCSCRPPAAAPVQRLCSTVPHLRVPGRGTPGSADS